MLATKRSSPRRQRETPSLNQKGNRPVHDGGPSRVGERGIEEQLRLDTCWHWEGSLAEDDMNLILELVAETMAATDYAENEQFDVQTALIEAMNNALRHGHQGDRTRPIRVRHHVDARRVLIEVEDQGEGFDLSQVPDPRTPENLDRPGGRGILMMRFFMDWVRYNRRGNCVTMCKYRTPE